MYAHEFPEKNKLHFQHSMHIAIAYWFNQCLPAIDDSSI